MAGARPDTLGVSVTRWSLKRMARYLRERQIVEICPAHLWRILAEAGLSFQPESTAGVPVAADRRAIPTAA